MYPSLLIPVLLSLSVAPAPGPTQRIQVLQRPQVILPRTRILRAVVDTKSVMVFRTRPDNEWAQRGLRRTMQMFGLRGQLQSSRTEEGLRVARSGERYAEAYEASGGTFCADLARIWPVLRPSQIRQVNTRALSREVVLQTAQQIVRELGALPKEPVSATYLPDEVYFELGSGEVQHYLVAAAVQFRRSVEGVLVDGPGSKLKVYFDTQGKPAGLLRTMRVLEPYRKLSVQPASRVLDEVKKKPMRRQLLLGVRSVEVTQIRLVYYEGPPDQKQSFLQPAYRFTGLAHGRVGEQSFTVPYCEYVPALVKPLEPMFGVGQTFKPRARKSSESAPQWRRDDE